MLQVIDKCARVLLWSKSISIYHQFVSLLQTIYKTYYAFSIKKIIYVTECYYGLQEIYSPILTQGKHEDSVSIYIYFLVQNRETYCRNFGRKDEWQY